MLPLERFRALLPEGCQLTDDELRKLVDQMYAVASVAVEQALAQRAARARLKANSREAVQFETGVSPADARPAAAEPGGRPAESPGSKSRRKSGARAGGPRARR